LFHAAEIKSLKWLASEKISRKVVNEQLEHHLDRLRHKRRFDTSCSMKEFIAYALVVLGIPIICGFLLAAIAYVPAYILLSHCSAKFTAKAQPYLEIFTGVGVAIAALVLFRWFKMTPNFAVPVILSVWTFIYFVQYKHSLSSWISWLAGFFIGWFTLAKMIIPWEIIYK
jgi:hypothetical protein